MVHSAYDSFELLSDCPTKIEAIVSYGEKLLLGCTDGSLRIYAPESSSSDRSPTSDYDAQKLELHKEPYVLERNVTGFSRKPLVSMEVLGSRKLLLSLSESIAFHRLPNLETIAVLTKAKGANVYCWDDRRGFLCFARQKRVCIFRHDGGRGFVEVKEFGVPDTVKSMSWCGENICLGIRREYMILNASNGALSEVFPSGRLAPPLVVSLPSGELLLGKDNIGVFVDQNGKLLQEGRICWSEAPTVVIIKKPYAIALLPRFVEVRSLRAPYPLIQTVVLRNVRHLIQSNNAVIVAPENSVYGLFPVPLGAQIVQLTASGDFEEALALCKLLPPEDSTLRAAKEGSIHIRYAHYLFENGNYEEAMEHFLASQVEITYVLSLYPSIILPKTTAVPEPEKLTDISWDSSHLSRASSDVSDDMELPLPPHLSESDESAALQSKKMSHNTLMALIKYLQKKRFSVIEKATAEGTEEVVLDAVGDNYSLYDSNRFKKLNKGRGNIHISSGAREMAAILDTALLQALLLTGQSSAALELLKGLNYCDLKICEEILQKKGHHTALLELYKCNSMHREALKLLNQLVEESKSYQMSAELTQKFKPDSIIEYLKPLCGTDPMLVLEFSMLVLESCPTQTIELFLSGNIPADLVNSYLKQHAPNMQATYLELMLAVNENGISGNLQNEMVHIYLSEVLDWHADLSAQQKWDEKAYSPTRKKLLSALDSISGYNPEALLKRLPADALYEERAILLGKMNQHELALSLYVHKLHVPELALSYCDRVYDSTVQPSARSSGNIYLTLLQIYLNPRRTTKNFEKRITNLVSPQNINGIPRVGSATSVKGKGGRAAKKIAAIEGAEDTRVSTSSTDSGRSDGDADESSEEGGSNIMLDEVLDLLSRRWDRVNGAQALKLLPRETKLQNLLPFLGPLLRKSSEAHRNFSVIKSLRQSENLQVKDDYLSLSLVISSEIAIQPLQKSFISKVPQISTPKSSPKELERSKLGSSDERTIYEVQQGREPLDVDFCSITIDGSLDNDLLQQRLHGVARQREELQQIETDLRAQMIARSEIMEIQNSFDARIKEHANAAAKLQEQLHERDQTIHELERKLEDKERELHAIKLDNEAAWAKEGLLREQNKELASFRRERDHSEAERAQHIQQIHDLQEHIQEKERQLIELQEQQRVAQETILYKDERLREAQSWIARVQEMDALQSTTIQAELRERTEQYNQLWLGCQRQFAEMERLHMHTIQQLQLELADARERSGTFTDESRISQENSKDVSQFSQTNGSQLDMNGGGTSGGSTGALPNGNSDNISSFVSAGNASTQIEHVAGVPIAPSSILGMPSYLPPGQLTALHPFVMHQQGVPQSMPQHVPQSHVGHFHSIPAMSSLQQWQNQQAVSDGVQISSQTELAQSQADQNLMRSDENYNYEMSVNGQTLPTDYLDVQISQGTEADSAISSSTGEAQVLESIDRGYLVAPQTDKDMQKISSQFHSSLILESLQQNSETKVQEQNVPSPVDGGLEDQALIAEPTSAPNTSPRDASIHAVNLDKSSVNNATGAVLPEAFVSTGQINTLTVGRTSEIALLDERSLLTCIVRTIPAGGRIRISSTLPNRLAKMLAPLHWHDYKRKYGKLDDFVAGHPELFVIEGEYIHLREGAQEMIAATAAVAKVAAAAAASSPYSSSLPSVAVTPMAQNHRVRKNQQPNGVGFGVSGGLANVKILSKSKDSQELNGLESRPSLLTVGNGSSMSSIQSAGSGNGRSTLNYGSKQQQGRLNNAGYASRR